MKTLVLTFAAVLATVAFAEEQSADGAKPERRHMRAMGPRGDRMPMGPMMMDPILRMVSNPQTAAKLGLTDEQVAKLKELSKGREHDRETQKAIRKSVDRQMELLAADKIDEVAVMATADEICEARRTAMKEQLKRTIAARSILTPEQLAKAKAMLEEFRGGRRPPRPAKDKQEAAPKADAAAKAK